MQDQRYTIKAWRVDKDGFLAGETTSHTSPDDFATFAKNCAANGETAIDQTAAGAKRPPDRPAPALTADPLAVAYAKAADAPSKLDVIAQRLGLKN